MISPGSDPLAEPPWSRLAALPGVTDAMAEARELVDRVLVHRALRSRTAALAVESALRGARASAALDGVDIVLEQARSGTAAAPVLEAALRVASELPRLRSVWRSSPRQALARLHVLATAGSTPPDQLGRPVGTEAAAALGRIGALSGDAAPAMLVAAVVHGELALAGAFTGGNELVARAASRLVLADKGLDPHLLCMPEVGHVELGDYHEALASYRRGDEARWIGHCIAAVRIGARESLAVAEAMVRG